ncbi:MAG: hypothetical protein P1V36_06550 [Planctomycetota bacterium]|nr:hypothetical protein [Planctomycetota bacterium]
MRARLLLPALLCLAACSTPTGSRRGAPAPTTPASTTAGLVRFDADAGIFPRRWHRPAVDVRATALAPARRGEARAWLDAALAKYPPGFLAQHVQAIHVLGALRFRGVDAGGSNSRRRAYVVMPQGHAARIYFERVVHAEISSILLRRRPDLLDEAAWRRCLLPGARYGSTGAAAVRHGVAGTWPTEWTLKQGFLYEYGMSSLENDFNSYASFAFTHPRKLLLYAARWPGGVGPKRANTLLFYRALDPRFASLGEPDLPSVDLSD